MLCAYVALSRRKRTGGDRWHNDEQKPYRSANIIYIAKKSNERCSNPD